MRKPPPRGGARVGDPRDALLGGALPGIGQTRVSENDVYIWPLKGTYFVFLPGKICRVKRVPISGTAQ